MKRYTWLLLLTATLGGQGCLGMEKLLWESEVVEIKAPEAEIAPPPIAPVTENDVNEANAAQMAAALDAELDRAVSQPAVQSLTAYVPPKR